MTARAPDHVTPLLDHEACYERLCRRDPRADGEFFVAVRSTKIYCRPICPARTPLRRNVTFFAAAAAAHAAGYRPCLRCRPESAPQSPAWIGTQSTINRALSLIEDGFLTRGSVDELAGSLGMTGRHLRRLFELHVGTGPNRVEQTRRIHLAKKLLHETALSVTEIAFAAGFGSVRRFNESFRAMVGRPPSAIRRDRTSRGVAPELRLSITLNADAEWLDVPDGVALDLSDLASDAQAVVVSRGARSCTIEFRKVPLQHLGRALARMRVALAVTPRSAVTAVSMTAAPASTAANGAVPRYGSEPFAGVRHDAILD